MNLYNRNFILPAGGEIAASEAPQVYMVVGGSYVLSAVFNSTHSEVLSLGGKATPGGVTGSDEVDALLQELGVNGQSAAIHIALDTGRQVLWPSAMYHSGANKDHYLPLFEPEATEEGRQQQVNDEITELYLVKKASHSFFKNSFKSPGIWSLSACLLTTCLKQDSKGSRINIHLGVDTAWLTVCREGKLLSHRSVDLITPDDILYHILHTLQVLDIKPTEVVLSLGGYSERVMETYELLSNYMQVSAADDRSMAAQALSAAGMPLSYFSSIISLVSCVS